MNVTNSAILHKEDVFPSSVSNCRKQVSDWRCRLYHEFCTSQVTFFVTLTIDDESMPLFTKDCTTRLLQKFIKRLRRNISYKYHKVDKNIQVPKFRYFLTSEYGETTHRLHFHCLFFFDTFINLHFFRQRLQEDWYYGFIQVKPVDGVRGIKYTTKYISKKYIERLVKLQSHGIGYVWFARNLNLFLKQVSNGSKPSCSFDGYKRSLPRYYLKKLISDDKVKEEYKSVVDSSYPSSLDVEWSFVDIAAPVLRSLGRLFDNNFYPERFRPSVIGYNDNMTLKCELPNFILSDIVQHQYEINLLNSLRDHSISYEEFKARTRL